MFKSTKSYGHEVGLSAIFRQPGAESHCKFLHGYALGVTITFGADRLDGRNWVVDFGALKDVKAWLQQMFDHTMLVAMDDPAYEKLEVLHEQGLAQMRVVPAVGCEAFAALIYDHVDNWALGYHQGLVKRGIVPPQGLHVISVEVREHGANSAIFQPFRPSMYGVTA